MKEILFRLRKERSELIGKIRKLEEFRKTDEWNKISVNHKQLLDIQLNAMKTYLECLIGRCIDIQMNLDKEDKPRETKSNEDSIKVFIVNLGEDKDE